MKEFSSQHAILTAPVFPLLWYLFDSMQIYTNIFVAISSMVLLFYLGIQLYKKLIHYNNTIVNILIFSSQWYITDFMSYIGINNIITYECVGEALLKTSVNYII